MPAHWRDEVVTVLKGTDYLDLTWNVIRRRGADAFNGKRIIPGLPS